MNRRLDRFYADKESFHEWIMACCDTLVREEDKIYSMTRDKTRSIDIIFPIRINEIPTMLIEIEKIVQNNEEKIIVLKNLENKEIEENEINNEND